MSLDLERERLYLKIILGAPACEGAPVDDFFPKNGVDVKDYVRKACRECPVRSTCLAYGLTSPLEDGVWGGFTRAERARLRRRMRVQDRLPVAGGLDSERQCNRNARAW